MSPFPEENIKVFYTKEACGLHIDILFYFNPSMIRFVDSNFFFSENTVRGKSSNWDAIVSI